MVKIATKFACRSKVKAKANRAVLGLAADAVITCVIAVDERVLLLSIYDKSEQADIPDKFLDQLLTDAGL